MKYKDYYKILGVGQQAKADEIKRAYRRLARKYHPDVSTESDAEDRFKELNEAYEVLKNPEKRAAYDQLGRSWEAGQEFRPPPGWNTGFESSQEFGGGHDQVRHFSDFFESLFGHAPGASASAGRSKDHFARIEIDLEDSYQGAERSISLQVPELSGDGRRQARTRTLNVRIPRGIAAGQQIRLRGQGTSERPGGPLGDLYLEVQFRPHGLYRVDGRDVYLELPLAPWEAALGAKVKAPTPAGVIDLSIPSGSQNGQQLRLKGRGIPGQPPGDMFVILKLTLPPADSETAKRIYRQMGDELAFNPRAALGV